MSRLLTALTILALPLAAQEADAPKPMKAPAPAAQVQASAEAENLLFRAFWLDRSERRAPEAIELYKKFLEQAPNHRHASTAAGYTLNLLNRTGKTEDAEAFKTKYAALLKNVEARPGVADAGEGRPQPEGRPGAGGRGEGRGGEGRPQGGAGGAGGRRGGAMGLMQKPITEMTDEELTQVQGGLERMTGMLDRMREMGRAEDADKMEAQLKKFGESLKAGKKDEAEKARQELIKLFPRRGGGN
ncbi:MAG: hypothetical protein IT458_06540 [Planctomycetes bacterium]|nr:hypothetical protein [Planctomycetota bacterium]